MGQLGCFPEKHELFSGEHFIREDLTFMEGRR
jgi:hypothetical protein